LPYGASPRGARTADDDVSVTNLLRRAAVTVALFVAPIGVVLTATPAHAATAKPTSLESQIIALTNKHRKAAGCAALATNKTLVYAARAHSKDMATFNYFSHTGRDGSTFVTRAARAGYSAASAENIAWGYRGAEAVVTGWMNSAGHRQNILTCSHKVVGVGVAKKADGTPYYTQIFGRA
jgi:uncharacterized protein YkwD